MVDFPHLGLRPVFARDIEPDENHRALSVCPGVRVEVDTEHAPTGYNGAKGFNDPHAGRGLAVWEGYAADPELRSSGSSGGIISALSVYCIDKLGVDFVSHVGMDPDKPWKNRNIISRTRSEVLRGSGSRYAPSSPCLSLSEIETADGKSVFVGKPCDAAAVALVLKQKPELATKVAAVISFFCAGTPSSGSVENLLHDATVEIGRVRSLRFRGGGWPGRFRAVDGSGAELVSLSYEESWGKLQSSRRLRCALCADGTGEIADIACGDAWHRHNGDGNQGLSVVVARTKRGMEIVLGAQKKGYIVLEPVSVDSVVLSQGSNAGLMKRRSEVWGRLLALRLLGVPHPQFKGFPLFSSWNRLSTRAKMRTVLGMVARVFRKKLLWRQNVNETEVSQ